MAMQSKVTIPPMELNMDQFLTVIRQLDEPARVQVARVLAETEMDLELRSLIEQLAKTSPDNDVGDAAIQAEVKAVRQEGMQP